MKWQKTEGYLTFKNLLLGDLEKVILLHKGTRDRLIAWFEDEAVFGVYCQVTDKGYTGELLAGYCVAFPFGANLWYIRRFHVMSHAMGMGVPNFMLSALKEQAFYSAHKNNCYSGIELRADFPRECRQEYQLLTANGFVAGKNANNQKIVTLILEGSNGQLRGRNNRSRRQKGEDC